MSEILFDAEARRRFEVQGLAVGGAVLGRSHSFRFAEHEIQVVIPTESPSDTDEWHRQTRKIGWKVDDPDNPNTTQHQVLEVELRTELPGQLAIDERAFPEPLKFRNVTDGQKRILNQTVDEYARLLAGAFEHWQRTLRWLGGHYTVGFPLNRVGRDPYGQTSAYLHRRADGRGVWSQTALFIVQMQSVISINQWQLIQRVLSSAEEPPIWFDFISEAHQRHVSYDCRGTIISAAIACETVIRSMFWLNLSDVGNDEIRGIIDRAPAQAILGKWDQVAGPCPGGNWEKGTVHALFDMRNSLMHLGEIGRSSDKVDAALKAATEFVGLADRAFSQRKGIPDWPGEYRALE